MTRSFIEHSQDGVDVEYLASKLFVFLWRAIEPLVDLWEGVIC